MPNPIKYSTSAQTLALKKGNYWIGTGDVGKGPTSTTDYWNGITPPTGGYTIYLNKASGGPSIYTAANDSQLISLSNTIAGQTFATASAALDWYNSQSDKMVFNADYPAIVTNGLIFNLDAGFTPSYPTTGTTWYDLSGTKNSSLVNGPTFSSANSGSIVFDGVDDRGDIPQGTFGYSPGTSGEVSLEIWVYPTGPFSSYNNEPPTTNLGGFIGQGYYGGSTGWGLGMFAANGKNYFDFQVRNQGIIVSNGENINHVFTNNNWYHVVGSFTRNNFSRVYINNILASSTDSTPLNGISITPNDANAQISKINPFFSGCRIAIARIYNRPLSATEVSQNYNAQKGRFGL